MRICVSALQSLGLRAGSLEGGLGVASQPISERGCIKQVRARTPVQAVLVDCVFCVLDRCATAGQWQTSADLGLGRPTATEQRR